MSASSAGVESQLSDFKPLERVVLPDVGDLRCSGLIMVVGPNSSGKSQLLQDIHQRLCGEPRALVVASGLEIRKPPEYGPFAKWLEELGYFETITDENGNPQWRPLTTYLGSGQPINQIQPSQAQTWYSAYSPTTDASARRRSEFLNYFGRLLVTGLFLERRLSSLNQVGVIDFQTQPPQQDLHALYLDDVARKLLFDELLESFGKAVWPDTSRGTTLCLRVSDEGVLPTAEERLSPKKMAAFRSIESEGDGLKSYVATCVALLLGRRPVCLIDEPEMCLHPPQAHNLGRFIGKYGTSSETVTLVATHSSQILRGVIQTAKDIQIIRLTRREKLFSAHLVAREVLAEAVAKPTVRAESVLDGIFAQSVVVVEADGDRLVYQTAWETLATDLRLDVHFATVGGTGGIADTCNLYRTLKIPVAVIADLDMLSDPGKLGRVLEVMATTEVVAELTARARMIMEDIRNLPPVISSAQVTARLTELANTGEVWRNESDIALRRDLLSICRQLDRMRQLKRGGLRAFPSPISESMLELLTALKRVGIFLVPVGELEEWFTTAEVAESKENKWAWANAAALHIQHHGADISGVWGFVREVGGFFSRDVPAGR
jgi:AAA domain, putative AbiEii toxin, Type IV TA system